jgi:ABC-2 type transport system permease protein
VRNVLIIAGRELKAYFATPVAYVFIVIFLALSAALTFYLGGFFERGEASLAPFFIFHPWLYLLLVPAIAMRLWAEERKSGTIELLITLPVTAAEAVIGKFLAAWAFIGVALLLTFPMWVTVNILGNPDNGVIAGGYVASLLMAGAFLAIGSCMSALTRNQVIAFVLAAAVCFLFTMSGLDLVQDGLRQLGLAWLADFVASLSFLTHFDSITKGLISLRDLVFFVSMIAFWLFATTVAIEVRKGA